MRFRVGLPEKRVGAGVGASGSRQEPFLQNLTFRLRLPSQNEWEPSGSRVGACGIPTTKPKVLHKASAAKHVGASGSLWELGGGWSQMGASSPAPSAPEAQSPPGGRPHSCGIRSRSAVLSKC